MRGFFFSLQGHMTTASLHAILRQVSFPRISRRATHTGLFAGIQMLLQICGVPSLLALMLAFAVVKLASSRQPDVHSSSCRTATAVATMLGAGVAGNFWGALLCLMFVSIAPREFLWWPPKQITRKALEKLAVRTARALSATLGEPVWCEYWGQPYGPKSRRSYRAEPADWHVPPGQWHSRTPIAFAFKRGGVDAQWELNIQPCHHAVAREQAAPPDAWSRVTLQELEARAKEAAESMSLELGVSVGCQYLGQPFGPAARRRYRREPSEWRVAAGSWHSQQTIAFKWVRADQTAPALSEQLCNHVRQRGVSAPADWPCVVMWAEVRQELEQAAAQAGREMKQIWQEELGRSLSCR